MPNTDSNLLIDYYQAFCSEEFLWNSKEFLWHSGAQKNYSALIHYIPSQILSLYKRYAICLFPENKTGIQTTSKEGEETRINT